MTVLFFSSFKVFPPYEIHLGISFSLEVRCIHFSQPNSDNGISIEELVNKSFEDTEVPDTLMFFTKQC